MNTPENYEKLAQKSMDFANDRAYDNAARKFYVQRAQVYATLAVAAATCNISKVMPGWGS
jgi:hypothetical protein